jgi:hypothetical protein
MRSEILALDLSRHHRSIQTLSSTHVAKSGQLLDTLIDASPSPVPESFLDAQERLENAAETTTAGLSVFLTALANQWRAADEVFWASHAAQQEAVVLIRDVDAALLIHPDQVTALEFQEDLDAIRTSVGALAIKHVPMPAHIMLPDQRTSNDGVRKVLMHSLDDAKRILAKAEAVVERYVAGARALDRQRVLRKDIEGASGRRLDQHSLWTTLAQTPRKPATPSSPTFPPCKPR